MTMKWNLKDGEREERERERENERTGHLKIYSFRPSQILSLWDKL